MKNDQAAKLIASLTDQLSLNSEEALKLEQIAENIYDLGYEAGQANYKRTPNPADKHHVSANTGRSGGLLDSQMPKDTVETENTSLPTV